MADTTTDIYDELRQALMDCEFVIANDIYDILSKEGHIPYDIKTELRNYYDYEYHNMIKAIRMPVSEYSAFWNIVTQSKENALKYANARDLWLKLDGYKDCRYW